jgi:hypothetical protein
MWRPVPVRASAFSATGSIVSSSAALAIASGWSVMQALQPALGLHTLLQGGVVAGDLQRTYSNLGAEQAGRGSICLPGSNADQ